MSLTQSNQRSISVTDKSESKPSTASLVSNNSSTTVSESRISTASSRSNPASSEVSSTAPAKTVVETATATVTKTTTETTTTTPRGGHAGLSSSGITGISVASGVAVVALTLFAIVCFLYLRQRNRDLDQKTHPDVSPTTSPKEPGVTTGFVGLPNHNLFTGASDSEIKKQLTSLGILIHHHVEGHYHRNKVLTSSETLHTALRQLQLPEPTCRKVVRLSIDPTTRCVAIRHLLAVVIFSNLDIHTVGSLSLLPPTVKELSRSQAGTPREEQYSLGNHAHTSAFLTHENPQTRTPLLPPPSVKSQAESLITLLQEYLVYFVQKDNNHTIDDQKDGLAGVIRQCVKFGYEIYSHPIDWEFTFPHEQQAIVVVPGLRQRTTNKGQLHDRPKTVLAPETVAVKPAKT
ncbi:hypothetical protein H9Q72_001105 [Fusarium xylarioides]|uniref:Uncharacterized protein n=1 Tax=Fusarium xylarioides TaxID=221167 RepID=A0A9P7LB53_9HYPO|nr:hypothetical protein H9Q72_001105 [Fusarium xylarioides]